MKSALLVSAVLLSSLASEEPLRSTEDPLRSVAEKGATLHKSFSEKTTWSLDSLDSGTGNPEEKPKVDGSSSRRLEVVDSYEAVEGGVATKLRREFTTVEGESKFDFQAPGGSLSPELELASELQGTAVVFERKSADSEPVVTLAGQKQGASKLLEGLREDLDLRVFVSEEGVSKGDSWKLDARELADVLAPGGDVKLLPRNGTIRAEFLQGLDASEILCATFAELCDNTGELSGEVLCTWKETKKEGGRELAVIEVEWDSTARTDESAALHQRLIASGSKTLRTDVTMLFGCKSEGKGQLVWDLAAHRAVSLALELDSHFDCRIQWSDDSGDGSLHLTLAAKSELAAKVEAK